MKWIREWWVPVAAVLAGMLIAFAQNGTAGAGTDDEEAYQKKTWQTRYEELFAKASQAEARIAASKKVIRKLRQRDRYKGQERADVDSELAAAMQELAEAKKELAAFPDDARRAGIPPGWLREVEDRHADPAASEEG